MGLNKQGVQYIDKNIPNLISLAADHFLANVLHQSSICRDRRVQGQQDILKKRRSNETYIRKRSREDREERLKNINERRQKNEKDNDNKSSTTAATTTTTKTKKKVKKKVTIQNGNINTNDDSDYNSLDDELSTTMNYDCINNNNDTIFK